MSGFFHVVCWWYPGEWFSNIVYFPFHIWDHPKPIDEVHHFSRWLVYHQPVSQMQQVFHATPRPAFFVKAPNVFHRPRRCRTSTSVTAHRRIASRWAMGHGPRLPAGRLQKGVTSGKSQDFGASNHIKYLGFQLFITHNMVSSCLFHMQVCYFGRWGLCSFGILRPFERHGFLDATGGPGHSKLLPTRPWRKRSEKRRKRVTSPGGCGFCQWIGV